MSALSEQRLPAGRTETCAGGWRLPLFVFVVVAAAHVVRLGFAPLAGTEGLRAMLAHQSLDEGNWVLPRLHGELYLRKPPGFTWLLAGAEAVGGPSTWAWRMPSVLSAAGLAAFLAVMARRWFGRSAGLAAGFACLALVPLWAQNRSADIDAANTLASVVAACALIELGFGRSRPRWAWSLVGGLALGAALLLKGPACLPLVGGVLVGAAVAARRWRWLLRPAVWVVVLIGAAVFGAWLAAAWSQLDPAEADQATRGLREVSRRVSGGDWRSLAAAVAAPFILVAYAWPNSAAAPVALLRATVGGGRTRRRRIILAIEGSFVGAVAIGAVAMITEPRYSYPALPLLCPLAGAVAAAWQRGWYAEPVRLRLRQAASATVFLLVGLHVAVTVMAWPAMRANPVAAATLGVLTAGLAALSLTCWVRRRVVPGAWTLAAMLVVVSVAFGYYKEHDQRSRSDYDVAMELRSFAGRGGRVLAISQARYRPHVYYYAGVNIVPTADNLADIEADIPDGALVLLSQKEWKEFATPLADRLSLVATLQSVDEPLYLMRWRSPPPTGQRSSGRLP